MSMFELRFSQRYGATIILTDSFATPFLFPRLQCRVAVGVQRAASGFAEVCLEIEQRWMSFPTFGVVGP